MSSYHPDLYQLAAQFNPELRQHGLHIDVTDENGAGLDLFTTNPTDSALWTPVQKHGFDQGPMRFWPPITVKDILDWFETNRKNSNA